MTATASPAWTVVRCPSHPRRVLGEIQGSDAVLRKDCPDCPRHARRWRYDLASGEMTLERECTGLNSRGRGPATPASTDGAYSA